MAIGAGTHTRFGEADVLRRKHESSKDITLLWKSLWAGLQKRHLMTCPGDTLVIFILPSKQLGSSCSAYISQAARDLTRPVQP